MRCFHHNFRQKKDNVLFDMVHVSTSDIKVRHTGDNVQDLQKWFAYTDQDIVGRVAKFDPTVGSRRTTKIKNLVVVVIILVVLILLPYHMYVV